MGTCIGGARTATPSCSRHYRKVTHVEWGSGECNAHATSPTGAYFWKPPEGDISWCAEDNHRSECNARTTSPRVTNLETPLIRGVSKMATRGSPRNLEKKPYDQGGFPNIGACERGRAGVAFATMIILRTMCRPRVHVCNPCAMPTLVVTEMEGPSLPGVLVLFE